MTGGSGKEHGTNKPPPTIRVQERSKGDTTCPITSQNPLWHQSWLNKACTTRKDSESEWLAKDNPETNPITIKPMTSSHVAELFSWVPLPSCSPPGCPFPIKSLALSARVSPRKIRFLVLDKSPVSGPGRGPPSSVQFSHSVVSNSATYESQHARPPCPSPTPGVHPNPHPLCQWCHPTIPSSVVPFSSCPQPFPASGSFQMSQLSTSDGQSTGVSA